MGGLNMDNIPERSKSRLHALGVQHVRMQQYGVTPYVR